MARRALPSFRSEPGFNFSDEPMLLALWSEFTATFPLRFSRGDGAMAPLHVPFVMRIAEIEDGVLS